MEWSKILLHSLLKWKKNPFHFIPYGHPNHDETSNFVDVTKIKADAEKAIATKEKTKKKRKNKKSTIFRAKKIKTIKKTAISNRKRKRNETSDKKKEKNDVSSKSSTNDSDENSVEM